MNTEKTIAERIKLVRGDEKLANFAKATGCNSATLRSYERGLSNPNFDFIQSLCIVKKVSPEWLIFGTGPKYSEDTHGNAQTELTVHDMQATEMRIRCAKLEEKLEKVENQRDELAAENRKLWKENGELKEKCARIEPRQTQEEARPFDERRKISGSSEVMQSRP